MLKHSDGDEKRLVQRLRRGDATAFAEWIDQFGPTVHRLSRRYAATESDAEDLTQEIFIALSRAIATFRGDSRLSTWAYRIAMNHCIKHLQRNPAQVTASLDEQTPISPASGSDPQVQAAHGELSSRIGDALGTLPEGQREVVILHEMHGLTYAECAQALGIPVGTVKSRLFHAFGRLRERLGSYVRGDEDPSVLAARQSPERLPSLGGGHPTAALAGRTGAKL